MGNAPAAAASSVAAGAKNAVKGVGVGVESDDQKAARERKNEERTQAKLQERDLRDQTRDTDYKSKQKTHALRKAELHKKWAKNRQENSAIDARKY